MDNLNLEILNTIKSKNKVRPFSSANKHSLKKNFLNNSYILPSLNNKPPLDNSLFNLGSSCSL